MILLIEIILITKAWKKGWKGWALLPAAIGIIVAFLLGATITASGGSPEDALAVGLIIDLMIITSLIVMLVRAPKHVEKAKLPPIAELATEAAA